MKTKLFAALLILLTLAVSIAAAQIDLSPYTMDFSPDARVKLVRPGLIVTIAKTRMVSTARFSFGKTVKKPVKRICRTRRISIIRLSLFVNRFTAHTESVTRAIRFPFDSIVSTTACRNRFCRWIRLIMN